MNNTEERQYTLEQSVKQLDKVKKKLKKLKLEEEALTNEIIAALGHEKEGQSTYDVDCWKVTCKTPFIYSLDTNAYKNGDVYLDPAFDPVKQTVKYEVVKSLYDKYFNASPLETRKALDKLVTIKPGKKTVTVGV